jgi:aryl sulfotransferase
MTCPIPAVSPARALPSTTLLASGLLKHEEADELRPRVYEAIARAAAAQPEPSPSIPRFVKVHDAYLPNRRGEALLAGARGAAGAVVIVRDPRDVAISLAHHQSWTIDRAIAFMGRKDATFATARRSQPEQLRQRLLDWSSHLGSWLDQTDLPIHLVRYEDLLADTAGRFGGVRDFAGARITRADAEPAARLASFSNLQAQERKNGFAERVSKTSPFFREGRAGAWTTRLSAAQVEQIHRDHGAMMARPGYPTAIAAHPYTTDHKAKDELTP